jgi:hypothetical protein
MKNFLIQFTEDVKIPWNLGILLPDGSNQQPLEAERKSE